ncbi:hypothetical protein FXO37_19703 [Capsicum annuum]|nr:hypothetical protein FXO37_19703 [Capsicum annuum]
MELLWPEDAESTTSMGVFPKEMEFRVPLGPRSLKGLVWGMVPNFGNGQKGTGIQFFPRFIGSLLLVFFFGKVTICHSSDILKVLLVEGNKESTDCFYVDGGDWLQPLSIDSPFVLNTELYHVAVAIVWDCIRLRCLMAIPETMLAVVPESGGTIRCPCWNCKYCKLLSPDAVRLHLYRKGFMLNYTVWTAHRESSAANNFAFQNYVEIPIRENNVESSRYSEMVRDVFGTYLEAQNEPNDEAKYFYEQLKEASHPLYEG